MGGRWSRGQKPGFKVDEPGLSPLSAPLLATTVTLSMFIAVETDNIIGDVIKLFSQKTTIVEVRIYWEVL